MREDIKSVSQEFGTMKFINFSIRSELGYIRIENEEAALKIYVAGVLSKEGGFVLKNFITALDPITGEVEREY